MIPEKYLHAVNITTNTVAIQSHRSYDFMIEDPCRAKHVSAKTCYSYL